MRMHAISVFGGVLGSISVMLFSQIVEARAQVSEPATQKAAEVPAANVKESVAQLPSPPGPVRTEIHFAEDLEWWRDVSLLNLTAASVHVGRLDITGRR